MPKRKLGSISPSRQISFHQLLLAARKTWLKDALAETLSQCDPKALKKQISTHVPAEAQKLLAAAGIRDEYVSPLPSVLEAKPTLVGYYRLLIGLPRKSFYASETGMGVFRGMETRGTMRGNQKDFLPDFCTVMGEALAELVQQLSPSLSRRDVDELPLLTLGSYIQGRNNTEIGKEAIQSVFFAIGEVVEGHIISRTVSAITLTNAAGREVVIALSSDPDIRLQERFGEELRNRVAIEIKGGTDKSNAYNRAGEAEKSHLRAKQQGFRDYWTIISKKSVDLDKLKSASPMTNSWFDAAQILGRDGQDWKQFRSRLAGEAGIPAK